MSMNGKDEEEVEGGQPGRFRFFSEVEDKGFCGERQRREEGQSLRCRGARGVTKGL